MHVPKILAEAVLQMTNGGFRKSLQVETKMVSHRVVQCQSQADGLRGNRKDYLRGSVDFTQRR